MSSRFFQSRFPNVITDPNLSGFFPKSHGWSRFETQGEYMEIDEDAYITIRSKEIVVLGKSGVVVHIVGDGRNGHHDDVQGYRNFQGTAYAGCRKEWFEDEVDAFSADQGIRPESSGTPLPSRTFSANNWSGT